MSWYFETLDPESKKLVHTVWHHLPKASSDWFRYLALAQRVWEESGSGVKFIKNLYRDPETTPVDPEEFFWIKLKSVPKGRIY